MVLAGGCEIVVYPELLQVMQECGLFQGIEATERELYWAGILREEFSGTSGASLQLPPNGHDASGSHLTEESEQSFPGALSMRLYGMRKGIIIEVTSADRARLQSIIRDRNSPQKHVWRARIIVLTADGFGTTAITRAVGRARLWSGAGRSASHMRGSRGSPVTRPGPRGSRPAGRDRRSCGCPDQPSTSS
jgi:hypothetical protein